MERTFQLDPSIGRVCNGSRPSIGGFGWRFKNAEHDAGRTSNKPVVQLDYVSGKPVAEWESGTLAADAIGICRISISRVCNGLKDEAGGYRWRFKRAEADEENKAMG